MKCEGVNTDKDSVTVNDKWKIDFTVSLHDIHNRLIIVLSKYSHYKDHIHVFGFCLLVPSDFSK